MLTGRSYTTSLGRPCLRESEASAGEFPLVFDGLGVFRGHFYRVIDFPNPRQNCHRTTVAEEGGEGSHGYVLVPGLANNRRLRRFSRMPGRLPGSRRANNRFAVIRRYRGLSADSALHAVPEKTRGPRAARRKLQNCSASRPYRLSLPASTAAARECTRGRMRAK